MRVLDDENPQKSAREFPEFSKAHLRKFKCDFGISNTYRNIYAVNIMKYRYCHNIYDKLEEFQMQDFLNYIDNVQQSILSINETKRSIYCALCDY